MIVFDRRSVVILVMVVGSLLFPDKKKPSNDLETA